MNTMTDPAFLAGQEHALAHAPDFRESPLSGEWAGESVPEIAHADGLAEIIRDHGTPDMREEYAHLI